jgi:transcriptional regulator with XRE-family HTH domain
MISGKKHREEREALLWTQKTVAEAAHVSVPAIERIERDREGKGVSVRPLTLLALAAALGVEPQDLMLEGTSRPLGELGSPLEQAKFQAARLERREAEGADEGDAFWMWQWGAAEQGVDNTVNLLRSLDGDPVGRREALDLMERFIALERRAEERYLELHRWTPQDAVSDEPVEAETHETIEANA